jgi:hypothetical protein
MGMRHGTALMHPLVWARMGIVVNIRGEHALEMPLADDWIVSRHASRTACTGVRMIMVACAVKTVSTAAGHVRSRSWIRQRTGRLPSCLCQLKWRAAPSGYPAPTCS